MIISFTANDAASVHGIRPGDRVAFTFRKSGTKSVLASIARQ